MFQIQRGGRWKEKKEDEDGVGGGGEQERGGRKWRWEGVLAKVTRFKSPASLFNGVLEGKPGQGQRQAAFFR